MLVLPLEQAELVLEVSHFTQQSISLVTSLRQLLTQDTTLPLLGQLVRLGSCQLQLQLSTIIFRCHLFVSYFGQFLNHFIALVGVSLILIELQL